MIIISDFDGTITNPKTLSTIGVFRKMFPNYKSEMANYSEYLETLNFDSETKTLLYAKKELQLLSSCLKQGNIDDSLFNNIVLRNQFKLFIDYISSRDIKFLISSSGIANVIKHVLDNNNIYYDNIKIYSNFYNEQYDFDLDKIIYSRKKYNQDLINEIEPGKKIVLMGNYPSDINMLPEYIKPTTTMCFSNTKYDYFDYIFKEDDSYGQAISLLKKM